MKTAIFAAALACVSTQAAAHEQTLQLLSEPTSADYAAAAAAVEPVIARVLAGDFEGAIEASSSGSEIFASKSGELSMLKGRARTLGEIYGPVNKCIIASRDHVSALKVKLSYVCQHREILVQWSFSVDHLERGWIITNFRFSDVF